MTAPVVSTQRGEDNAIVITNLIVIEFRGGCAGWRLDLYNCQNLLQGGQERTDTSRRSSLPSSLCVADPSAPDFPRSSWCTSQHDPFDNGLANSYLGGIR